MSWQCVGSLIRAISRRCKPRGLRCRNGWKRRRQTSWSLPYTHLLPAKPKELSTFLQERRGRFKQRPAASSLAEEMSFANLVAKAFCRAGSFDWLLLRLRASRSKQSAGSRSGSARSSARTGLFGYQQGQTLREPSQAKKTLPLTRSSSFVC